MNESLPDIPRATLRLQLNGSFDFDAATNVVPYVARLGVSHLYLSPITRARPGSLHGYDVVDHGTVNPELGGEAGFARLSAALQEHGLGLVLDFVPNHMGVGGSDNAYWLDLLEWGASSSCARWFDVDWEAAEESLRSKVLVPFLGAPYGEALESGDIRLDFDADSGSFSAWYFDHRLPIAPASYADILERGESRVLAGAAARARTIAGRPVGRRGEAEREAAFALKDELARLAAEDPAAREALEQAAAAFAGTPGEPQSFLRLHRLLERQHWRLSFWRVASDEINYRRFFDINDLAGLRVEDPVVFEDVHALLLSFIAGGQVTGVRLDHVDGLYDPAAYCRRLQDEAAARLGADPARLPLYLLIEKILAPYERMPEGWPVHGTTGYTFMASVNGLFVAAESEEPLTRLYQRFTGRSDDFEQEVARARPQILRHHLSSEFTVLARRLTRLAKRHRHSRDFTYPAISQALTDVVAAFPVYRTYLGEGEASETDRRFLDWAVKQAVKAPGLTDESVYGFLHQVLLATWQAGDGGEDPEVREIARKFQQLTSPVMAKSVEDTAFYRYARLLALNEVGGEPGHWGTSVNAFHHQMQARAKDWPAAMLATATHDHKRGEDTRARLAVLTERPAEWARAVRRFSRLNRHRRRQADDGNIPSRNDEYFFYQTLVGAWHPALSPDDEAGVEAYVARLGDYMVKAAREAKLRTSWARPDEAYESGLADFLRQSLRGALLREAAAFVESLAPAAAVNGLAQLVLKLTCPGVPDLYQGTELWDFSLVDPDNRRPVDFAARADLLASLPDDPSGWLAGWRDGRIKLWVTARLLDLRRRRPALFGSGDYAPATVEGPAADRVVAFSRSGAEGRLLVVVPRLVAGSVSGEGMLRIAPESWGDTRLAADVDGLHCAFTGRRFASASAAALLDPLPVCVLEGAPV